MEMPSFNLGVEMENALDVSMLDVELIALLSSLEQEDVLDEASAKDQASAFLVEDDDFQEELAKGGSNPSWPVDQWATNRLNAFRVFKGFGDVVSFEFPGHEIVHLLYKFFEQTCKMNGKLYSTMSLMGLYSSFDKILRRMQEKRVM